MFRNVLRCSGISLVPDFKETPNKTHLTPISLICDARIKTPASIWRFASVNHVIGMPLLYSKIWRPLCSLFVRHGCFFFFFFKFTLATGVLLVLDRYSKISESGVDICEENSEKYRNTYTVDFTARTGKASQMEGR